MILKERQMGLKKYKLKPWFNIESLQIIETCIKNQRWIIRKCMIDITVSTFDVLSDSILPIKWL